MNENEKEISPERPKNRAWEYVKRFGFAVIPLIQKSKSPAVKEWQKGPPASELTEEEIRKRFTHRLGNIGVRCGEPSGGLVDIDLDDDDAARLAPAYLPETGFRFGRKSRPCSHWFFRVEGDLPSYEKLKGSDDECLVEIRSTGSHYTVLPDSVHPSGEKYDFERPRPVGQKDLAVVDAEALVVAVHELAAATILAKLYPKVAGQRHDIALALGGWLARLGWAQEKAQGFLRPVFQLAGDEEVEARLGDVEDTFAKVKADGPATGLPRLREFLGEGVDVANKLLGGGAGGGESAGSVINVSHEIEPMQNKLETFLRRDGGVYQRGGELVRVVGTDDGGKQIVSLARATLTKLASVYSWTMVRKEKPVRVKPPVSVIDALLEERHWNLPVLRAVITSPTLLADGSILEAPGYHAPSGLYYEPSAKFESVPVFADRQVAEDALAEIKEIFCDFPFAEDGDLAAVLGMVFTQILRHTIDGPVPMFAIRAPTAGTGKGLLLEAHAVLTTGKSMPLQVYPKGNEEELRKTLFSLAHQGSPLACFDNMTGSIKSPALCNFLTSRMFGTRILTTMKAAWAPATVVLYATGNNIQPLGDMVRRTVCIDLDPRVERPEFRNGFKHQDLRGYVLANRARLVPLILGLVKAYQDAGRPDQELPVIGSYEHWSAVVREPLAWLGAGDPGGKLLRGRQGADDEEEVKIQLLRAWWDEFKSKPVTGNEVLTADCGTLKLALVDALKEAKLDNFGEIRDVKPRGLGAYLGSMKNRIFSVEFDQGSEKADQGLRLRLVKAGRSKLGARWKLEQVGNEGRAIELESEPKVPAQPSLDDPF